MANRVQRLRHTTTALANFTGLEAEITVNLSNNSLIVHDGITPGGHEVALSSLTNVAAATTSTSGKMTDQHVRDLALALQSTVQNAANIVINADNIAINLISINNLAQSIAQNAADISALAGGTGNYLLLAGGTMTGVIILAADPIAAMEPSTKQYTDSGDAAAESAANLYAAGLAATLEASKADRAGDTFTGPVILAADPVAALGAATRQFVLSEIAGIAGVPARTAGTKLCGFAQFHEEFRIRSSSVERCAVLSIPIAGIYSIKISAKWLAVGFNSITLKVLVYKNGAYTGQTVTGIPVFIQANEVEAVLSFTLADATAEGDVIDFRIQRVDISGDLDFAMHSIAVFAAENPITVPIAVEPAAGLFTI